MKKTIIILSVIALFAGSCKQITQKRIAVEMHKENNVSQTNIKELPKVESIDIPKLLWKETAFIGMIGDDIQKMGIVFLSTTKTSENKYEVIGKSKVKNNVCDFKGIIEAQHVIESDIDSSEIATVDGKVTGKYLFHEDRNQSGTGTFEGTFEIYWTYSEDSTIVLADFWYTASEYTILFTGNWKSYQTGSAKQACWSDYKGCFPADFDCSDGPDLIPNEKYRSNGWGYEIDIFSSDTKTREKAEKEYREHWVDWWK